MPRLTEQPPRSGCPIASTLEIVGDRWTLVILRDMFTGKKRFSEFLDSPERITTSVLTDRLALMEARGLIERTPYQLRPTRFEYLPTKKGMGLLTVLQEISRWGNRFIPDTWVPPTDFMDRETE